MKKEKDIVTEFWTKWIEADPVDREKLLKPIVKMVDETSGLPKKHRRRILAMCLNSYLEDFYNVVESRKVKK